MAVEKPVVTYILRVTLSSETETRQFCQVNVKGNDVYAHQPHPEKYLKTSHHESGERHQKEYAGGSKGPALKVMWLERPDAILTEDVCWDADFHNFSELLPYDGEPVDNIFADDTFNIKLPCPADEFHHSGPNQYRSFISSKSVGG
jgi:hypothetical protein